MRRPHFPQLDGLRALLALAVPISHYGLASDVFAFGYHAVNGFMVLSGFLITGILLRQRQFIDEGRQSVWWSFGRFEARRLLRIFAPFWALLALGVGGTVAALVAWLLLRGIASWLPSGHHAGATTLGLGGCVLLLFGAPPWVVLALTALLAAWCYQRTGTPWLPWSDLREAAPWLVVACTALTAAGVPWTTGSAWLDATHAASPIASARPWSPVTWHTFYLSNHYYVAAGGGPHVSRPFWSLAVEEQLYLLWPFAVFLTPARRRCQLIIGVILAAAAWRAAVWGAGLSQGWGRMPLFAAMDLFAWGSAVAMILAARGTPAEIWDAVPPARRRLLDGLAVSAAIGVVILRYPWAGSPFSFPTRNPLELTLEGGVFAWLVFRLAVGFSGPVGRVLAGGLLRWCSRLSYEFYLLHMAVWFYLAPRLAEHSALAAGLLMAAASLGIARVWAALFGEPLTRAGRRLRYERDQPARDAAASPVITTP